METNKTAEQIRERILHIRKCFASLEEEEEALIQALHDKGFVLVCDQVNTSTSDVESHVTPVTAWQDWKVGDILEVESEIDSGHEFDVGDRIMIRRIDWGDYQLRFLCDILDEEGDDWWVNEKEVKWISRGE